MIPYSLNNLILSKISAMFLQMYLALCLLYNILISLLQVDVLALPKHKDGGLHMAEVHSIFLKLKVIDSAQPY